MAVVQNSFLRPAVREFPAADTASDEELARRLQEQLNAEQWGLSDGGRPASSFSRPGGQGQLGGIEWPPSGDGGGFTAAQPPSSAGTPANNAGSRPPPAPTPAPVTMGQRPAGGLATGGMLQSLGALGGSEACGGCGKPVRLWQGYASAGDRRFHTWCLKCAGCGQQIQVRATRGKTFGPPRLEMHVCAAQRKCAACLPRPALPCHIALLCTPGNLPASLDTERQDP